MKRTHQFNGMHKDAANPQEACPVWADMLPDAAEGLLNEGDAEALDQHVLTCAGCAWQLADAQRGAAWLALLKGYTPEPPATLLNAILAKTSGHETNAIRPAAALSFGPRFSPLSDGDYIAAEVPVWAGRPEVSTEPASLLQRMAAWFGLDGTYSISPQPRLAMTSATAFFSVCLTLNVLGVSVRSLRAEALRPAGLQRTMAEGSASLVRSLEGIRFVYRVESRVNEWRTASTLENDAPLDRKP